MPNKRKKRVYIAGPMSGLPDYNRPAFFAEAARQLALGNIPLNPATLPDGLTQCEYMQICAVMVMMADELIMLPSWVNSSGAEAEFRLALKCNKTIHQLDDPAVSWYPTTEEEAA